MGNEILLIEDEMPAVAIYEKVFRKAGFKIKSLMTGEEALSELKKIKKKGEGKPKLILLDLILPDMNGIEILKEVKSEEETKDIPVVILTNYKDPGVEQTGENLGAKTYIVKTDITPDKIVSTVEKYLT